MTQVLIIGYVWPEPRSSAAGSRMMQLIRLFRAQDWKVTFATPAVPTEHQENLSEFGVEAVNIELNNRSFDDFVSHLNPDLVVFDRFMMEEQFGWRVTQQCPYAMRVLNTEDLHSLRYARHELLKGAHKHPSDLDRDGESPSVDTLFQHMATMEMAQREISAIYRCDLSLMMSGFEMALLKNQFRVPEQLLLELPFLLPEPKDSFTGFEARHAFISIGNFRHAPNWDAVLWLKQAIWPRIRQQLPDAELHIYGAYPPPKATALHNPQQGFLVKGWARDAVQVMSQARVCLAPLRFGAGLKGKLVEAMQCGTPSVTTDIGAESMSASMVWSGSIANGADAFAAAAVRLYTHQSLWENAQAQGVRILQQGYDEARHGRRLLEALAWRREHLVPHRRDNFMGALLRLHQHKSTQYMAQWIEAKNRLKQHLEKKS